LKRSNAVGRSSYTDVVPQLIGERGLKPWVVVGHKKTTVVPQLIGERGLKHAHLRHRPRESLRSENVH
jgi:hypothetical protein